MIQTRSSRSRMALTLCPGALLSCVAALLLLTVSTAADAPTWLGQGKYRLLVRVDPLDIGNHKSDEMPTRIHLSSADVLQQTGAKGKINVGALEVEQYDPATGQPIPYGKWAYAHEPWEVPYRWYDDAVPEDFPEVVGKINPDTGELKYTPERNWGYFYETLGEWDSGNLAWTHTQRGNQPSYYAIYFDLLPPGKQPDALPRTGFVGDGTERTEEIAPNTHGLLLSRVEVADWDGDGVQDLVCGAEWNRAVWYKNVGTNAEPKLVYKGLIYADDGKPFQLPHEPVPEITDVYKTDYHPVLAAADINGDGRIDILAGGYVTGRIYLFENKGWNPRDHTPILHFAGPVEADGQPLDVGWAAAPAVADVDGDGLLDMISGNMPMTPEGGDSASSENFLYYFKNVGTRTKPRFSKQKFPIKGKFPVGAIAAPRLADLNGDGHFDLVHGFTVQLNLNKGNPQFFSPDQNILGPGEKIFHRSPTGDQWTFTYVVDLDGDGKPDILYGVHQGWVYFHRNLSSGGETKFDTEGERLNMSDGDPIKVGPAPDHPWDFDVLQGARTTVAAADFDHDG